MRRSALRDREVFLFQPLEAAVDLVEVPEHLVAQLGDPSFHRVELPPKPDRSFKCVRTWTQEDVPRPISLG